MGIISDDGDSAENKSSECRLLWRSLNGGEAELLRVYSNDSCVKIPGMVEGKAIARLGDYCFSQSEHLPKEGVSESFINYPKGSFLPLFSGEGIEKIILPDSVKSIGSSCFYNCWNLKQVEMGSLVQEFGSGCFMNCGSLKRIIINCHPWEKSGIRGLLGQITLGLEILFKNINGRDDNEKAEAAFYYPEYSETYNEVGPAHIFELRVRGGGFRARQFIRDGLIDAKGYDSVFDFARNEEPEEILIHMALLRLLYPWNLGEEEKARYLKYLKCQEEGVFKLGIEKRNMDVMEFLYGQKDYFGSKLNYGIALASQKEWAEGAAFLLRWKQETAAGRASRYEF